jgi:hypothetical protein
MAHWRLKLLGRAFVHQKDILPQQIYFECHRMRCNGVVNNAVALSGFRILRQLNEVPLGLRNNEI